VTVDGNDVFAVYEAVGEAVNRARKQQGPTLVECKTYRHRGHFEGDPVNYRSKEELQEWMEKDPIQRMEKYLLENDVASEDKLKEISDNINSEIEEAVKFAKESPFPDVEASVEDVYSDIVEEVK
ncbi:MAG TPA: pyruvate dehydrogenase (acetyl-transferring) E1 component subunit alpha, partial [Clostridiales bacterium]|nr:pyruvate dehydrogenase (acetyl-transferring) E1 component subunit alpha [Clostridiales bacterium]